MDRLTTSGAHLPSGNANPNPMSNPATNAKVEDIAQTAHQAVDKVADKATAQVDRLSGSAHRAVNSAADVAGTAADWASTIPDQASQVQTKLTEAARASIRGRPIATVAGALVVGYLFARIAGRRTD
jgi:ElaB protein